MAASPLKPLLKWPGGKSWLLPHLKPLWAGHEGRRLVEPFCGGLAVALGLRPRRALLNDVNPHLINLYRWIQQGLEITLPMENDPKTYYAYRKRFNELIALGTYQTNEAAMLFYYLNRTGYNGLCRFNRKGEFNVPFGRYQKIRYRRRFPEYQEAFAGWTFTSSDFEEVPLEPEDFVYADPPYDVEFTRYTPEGFTWEDQVRLAHWLAKHPGPVVVSNGATERIIRLYEGLGFRLHFLLAPRRISANGNRTPALEILAIKGL